jgi:4-amino-4-deoxy-L-arabinose transferase-like glycosyltransferase
VTHPFSVKTTPEEKRIRPAVWAGILLVFTCVYLGALFSPGLLDDADATHAEAAREMARSGDFVTLRVNGLGYLEKARLPYWLVATSYLVFGENEFATRLPIALAVLACALLAMRWSRRAFGTLAGVYAALITLTTVGVFLFTRIFIPEILLSLLLASNLYFWLTALEDREPWRWYAGYAALALAVLTKGLVALAFAGGTALIFLFITGDWRRWREFRLFTGLLLFLAVAAPWHVLAGMRNPGGAGHRGFFWFYFVNEHVLRFLGKRLPRDYNKMPALAYWLAHLVWLFPWSLFLPLTIRELWSKFRAREITTFADRTHLLCVIYAGFILLFFSLSTNQEYYTFPAYLPLILLTSAALARAEGEAQQRWLRAGHLMFAVLGVAAAAMLSWGLWSSQDLPYVPDVATVLAKRGVGEYTLAMSHFFDLTGESFAALRLPAALAAIALLVGPLSALMLRYQRRHHAATWAIAGTVVVFLIAAGIAFGRFGSYLSSKHIAAQLKPQLQPGDMLMIYGDQAAGSSLLFYLKRPIYLVNGATTSMQFGSTFPDAPKIFLNDPQLREAWQSDRRIFLFFPSDRRARVEGALGRLSAFPVIVSGEKLVLSNRR